MLDHDQGKIESEGLEIQNQNDSFYKRLIELNYLPINPQQLLLHDQSQLDARVS